MAPPMIRVSTFSMRLLMTPILSETFAPPRMATKGRTGFSRAPPITSSSLPIRKPATAASHRPYCAIPAVEACARCAVPKASFTYMSQKRARALQKFSSFLVSSSWKRRFSRSTTSPSLQAATAASAAGPITSEAKVTLPSRSSFKRAATGLREHFLRVSATSSSRDLPSSSGLIFLIFSLKML